jgi:transposase
MSKIRKSHSAEFKYKVALEALKEQETLAALSQKYSVHGAQIQKWKSQLQKEGSTLFSDKRGKPAKSQDKMISQLHEKIGKLTVEKDFLEHVLSR